MFSIVIGDVIIKKIVIGDVVGCTSFYVWYFFFFFSKGGKKNRNITSESPYV